MTGTIRQFREYVELGHVLWPQVTRKCAELRIRGIGACTLAASHQEVCRVANTWNWGMYSGRKSPGSVQSCVHTRKPNCRSSVPRIDQIHVVGSLAQFLLKKTKLSLVITTKEGVGPPLLISFMGTIKEVSSRNRTSLHPSQPQARLLMGTIKQQE